MFLQAVGRPEMAGLPIIATIAICSPRAPRSSQAADLKLVRWMFRLASEPRRVLKHQAIGNAVFLWTVLSGRSASA